MADAATKAIRDALRAGREPDDPAHPDHIAPFRVAEAKELLGVYPHVRVQHGGWVLERGDGPGGRAGYFRRWNIWCRYAYPGDPTDEAYEYEENLIALLHGGRLAIPVGEGGELRLYRADGGVRFLASRLRMVEL